MTLFPPIDEELRATVRRINCLACADVALRLEPELLDEGITWIRDNADDPNGVTVSDAHHVDTVGAGGEDLPENLMPLCRRHHAEWDHGNAVFLQRYPTVETWLELAGRQDVLDRVGKKPVGR